MVKPKTSNTSLHQPYRAFSVVDVHQIMRALVVIFILLILVGLLLQWINGPIKEYGDIELTNRIWLYEPVDEQVSIEMVTSDSTKPYFRLLNSNYLNLGKRQVVWLKIDLGDSDVEKLGEHIVEVSKNGINSPADIFYQGQSDEWKRQALQSAPMVLNNLVSNIPADIQAKEFYIRLSGQYLRATIEVYNQENFLRSLQSRALYNGFFYGMLFLVILGSFMLYLKLKVKAYLAYASLLLILFTWFANGQGWIGSAGHIKHYDRQALLPDDADLLRQ